MPRHSSPWLLSWLRLRASIVEFVSPSTAECTAWRRPRFALATHARALHLRLASPAVLWLLPPPTRRSALVLPEFLSPVPWRTPVAAEYPAASLLLRRFRRPPAFSLSPRLLAGALLRASWQTHR